jgi:hypothetical protein
MGAYVQLMPCAVASVAAMRADRSTASKSQLLASPIGTGKMVRKLLGGLLYLASQAAAKHADQRADTACAYGSQGGIGHGGPGFTPRAIELMQLPGFFCRRHQSQYGIHENSLAA